MSVSLINTLVWVYVLQLIRTVMSSNCFRGCYINKYILINKQNPDQIMVNLSIEHCYLNYNNTAIDLRQWFLYFLVP